MVVLGLEAVDSEHLREEEGEVSPNAQRLTFHGKGGRAWLVLPVVHWRKFRRSNRCSAFARGKKTPESR